MSLRAILRATSLVVLFAIFGQSALSAQTATATRARIKKKTYDFKEAKKEMEYYVFVPSRYDAKKKSALIIVLHGLGGTPQGILRYPGMTDLAEKHGYILAAPMGYNTRGWYGTRGTRGGRRGEPENLGELSEKDVLNVLEIVRKDYSIDPNRIYIMGHSMGGGGTIHFAIKNPKLWAAAAPLAPALFRSARDVAKMKDVPTILVQGDNDRLCPVGRARQWVEEMKKLKMTHKYIEIKGGDHVTVAWKHLADVFAFFNKHKKSDAK